MTNPTATAFGYPHTLVAETTHWLVLVRPKQPTWGSLALVCKEPVQAFADLSAEAFVDLKVATTGIEAMLGRLVAYERINYLMLMMVDPDVHFHVLPRYAQPETFAGLEFTDAGWPAAPNLGHVNATDAAVNQQIINVLQSCWP